MLDPAGWSQEHQGQFMPDHTSTPATADFSSAFAGSNILLIGASGNLGSHLASQLAGHGARLTLWGRSTQRLADVANSCKKAGIGVTTRSIDLMDLDTALTALRDEDDFCPYDGAFFAAGCGDTREAGMGFESPELINKLALLNYVAPAVLAAELGTRMASRRGGRLVIVGTAAATHPLPFAVGYTSSKAGLSHFAEAARVALAEHGVSVTLVSPGFFAAKVDNAYAYSRPGEISAENLARAIIKAAAHRQAELITPFYFWFLRWIGSLLPRFILDRLMHKLPAP